MNDGTQHADAGLDLRIFVLEDDDGHYEQILECLARKPLCLRSDEVIVARRTALQDARDWLVENHHTINLVLLDLYVDGRPGDASPSEQNGVELLKWLDSAQGKPIGPEGHRLEVDTIVVSSGVTETQRENYSRLYPRTVFDAVPKLDIRTILPNRILQWQKGRHKLGSWLAGPTGLGSEVAKAWRHISTGDGSLLQRVNDAQTIAIAIAHNVASVRVLKEGGKVPGRNLKNLLDDEPRRSPQRDPLWRGNVLDQLYLINGWRNQVEHSDRDFPFDSAVGLAELDNFKIPGRNELLIDRMRRYRYIESALAVLVEDLLHWYRPWHEGVFLPIGELAEDSLPPSSTRKR